MWTQRAAVIALLGCAGGCTTTGGKVSAVFAGVTATSAILVLVAPDSCPTQQAPVACIAEDGGQAVLAAGLIAVTAAALIVSAVFEAVGHHADPSPPASTGVNAEAAQLTHEAYLAARDGKCGLVASLGAKVQAIAPLYYDRVFTTDPTLSSCL